MLSLKEVGKMVELLEVICSLIEKGKIDLAIQIFDALDPDTDKRAIIERLIDGLLKENKCGCEKNIMRLKDLLGRRLNPEEAHIILAPYFKETNASHRPYYCEVDPEVLKAAPRSDVVLFMELVIEKKGVTQWDLVASVFEILKTKI